MLSNLKKKEFFKAKIAAINLPLAHQNICIGCLNYALYNNEKNMASLFIL